MSGTARGEAQLEEKSTVHHASAPPQRPSRRLRRCCCSPCCSRTGGRLPEFVIGYSYRVIAGAAVYSGLVDTYEEAVACILRQSATDLEVERVWLYASGGTNYELIRGGRWVYWWEAQYGVHEHEPREKIRCTS